MVRRADEDEHESSSTQILNNNKFDRIPYGKNKMWEEKKRLYSCHRLHVVGGVGIGSVPYMYNTAQPVSALAC